MTTRKERWVEALRSGRYEQGQGYLCRDGRYCCLGVLADLDGRSSAFRHGSALHYREGLTASAAAMLAEMNDRGQSFGEIADYIKKKVKVEEL